MKPTFENTVSILVKAYLNDTLEHADCSACAVGNIIASSMGFSLQKSGIMRDHYRNENFPCHDWGCKTSPKWQSPKWQSVFCTRGDSQKIEVEYYKGEAKRQIESTGYTLYELAGIESAFELAPYGKDRTEWMFNGLMAVVDVLAEIHNVDLSVRESAKLQFVKP